MPCLEQFPLRAGDRKFLCPYFLRIELRMGSLMNPFSILVTNLGNLQIDLQNWCSCEARHLIFAKIKQVQ